MSEDYPAPSAEPACSRPVDAMTNNWKALCAGYEPGDGSMDGAQLVDGEWWHPMFGCDSLQMVADRARALLDQQEPQPPAAGEVAELVRWLRAHADEHTEEPDGLYTHAADLLQRQHPQPVAVSERPWEREGWSDEQGRCWIFMPDIGTDPSWRLTDPRDTGPYHTHSLPANALPTPEANAQ